MFLFDRQHKKWRHDVLVARMQDKEMLVHWLMEEGVIAKDRSCPMCAREISLTRCEDRSDGLKWECRKQVDGKRHSAEVSIRKVSAHFVPWSLRSKSLRSILWSLRSIRVTLFQR